MPITSPSYFPPSKGNGTVVGITAGQNSTGSNDFLGGTSAGKNSTINNLIVIGANSGGGGLTDNTNLVGTIIIGVGSANRVTVGVSNALPLTLVGANNLANFGGVDGSFLDRIDSTVIVGSKIINGVGGAFGNNDITTSVFCGNNLFSAATVQGLVPGNVVIGNTIGSGAIAIRSFPTNSVIIGSSIFTVASAASYDSSVVIGSGIELGTAGGTTLNTTVAIGNNMTIPGGSSGNIVIGSGATFGGATQGSLNNVVIGEASAYIGNNNVCIGGTASVPANVNARGNVVIGFGAGTTVPNSGAPFNGLLVIESNAGAGVQTLLYGQFLTGNMVVGNSIQGTNRDLGGTPGTNMLKLLNGTPSTGANVIGGGYFYVNAGALHWVGSSGTDTPLAVA